MFYLELILIEEHNSALNYGYTILLTEITRTITKLGYSTLFGIHHCSETNPYNFSCDIIEPFRPIIDKIVYYNFDRILDKDYKKELITSLYLTVNYKNKKLQLSNCIELYLLDIIRFLESGIDMIGEIIFDL